MKRIADSIRIGRHHRAAASSVAAAHWLHRAQTMRRPGTGGPLRGSLLALVLALGVPGAVRAAPYVAYVGNVPVHTASPEAKVMVVDVATGAAVNVSQGLSSARSPAWAPDGSRLAFEAIENGLCDIFVCRPNGSERVNVTATPEAWEASPAFVGPGRLAYLEGPDRTDLVLLDLTTREKRTLSEAPRFYTGPVPSPDGRFLAVVGAAKLGGPGDLYLIATDGSGTRNLTRAPALYSPPTFTPDGTRILVAFDGRNLGGTSRGVAALPVAGGKPTLVAKEGYPLAPVSVSADGTRLAYASSSGYHTTWVRVAQIDGRDDKALEAAQFHIIGWPSLAPDGGSVAFQGVYAATYTIHLHDLAAGKTRRLSPEGETGVCPVFSPR
jgi:Tol biopolymer transport system component